MNACELTAVWAAAGAEMLNTFEQTGATDPVRWKGQPVRAIVDSVPFSAEQRDEGGGLLSDFAGSIVFFKSEFAGPVPAVGDIITIGARRFRLATSSCKEDAMDPTLTFLYSSPDQ